MLVGTFKRLLIPSEVCSNILRQSVPPGDDFSCLEILTCGSWQNLRRTTVSDLIESMLSRVRQIMPMALSGEVAKYCLENNSSVLFRTNGSKGTKSTKGEGLKTDISPMQKKKRSTSTSSSYVIAQTPISPSARHRFRF